MRCGYFDQIIVKSNIINILVFDILTRHKYSSHYCNLGETTLLIFRSAYGYFIRLGITADLRTSVELGTYLDQRPSVLRIPPTAI